jgi:CBS domain-containing protein
MRTVAMLLQNKGDQVFFVGPETRVIEALQIMADKNIGAVLVLNEGEVVGIFSERDYTRKGELNTRQADDTQVSELMTDQVICVRPDMSIDECMALMTNHRIRHLPVLEGERLAGLISIGDVVKSVISEQKFVIEQLEEYITLPR